MAILCKREIYTIFAPTINVSRCQGMKRLIIFLLAVLPLALGLSSASAKADKKVVVFYVDLHCQGCCDKIMKNIAFEKGVKDIVCDLQAKTVTVTYDANKTDIPTLQKAFARIGKPATTTPPVVAADMPPSTNQGAARPSPEL